MTLSDSHTKTNGTEKNFHSDDTLLSFEVEAKTASLKETDSASKRLKHKLKSTDLSTAEPETADIFPSGKKDDSKARIIQVGKLNVPVAFTVQNKCASRFKCCFHMKKMIISSTTTPTMSKYS